jgi:hypothetical protein
VRVRLAPWIIVGFETGHGFGRGFIPKNRIAFVHGIYFSLLGNTQVIMGQKKFADAGIKRKSVHSLSCRIDKHG